MGLDRLDLILTSDSSLVSDVAVLPPVGKSDHCLLHCELNLPLPKAVASRLTRIYCYDKADQRQVNRSLSNADWSAVSQAISVDKAWDEWLKTFRSTIDKAVPSKVVGKIVRKKPWITPDLLKLIKEKH